jgi:NitT/TauT family transport system substrate-binding protein
MTVSARAAFLRHIALAGAAAATATLAPRAGRAQALTPITIAAIPSDISGEAYYAQDRGFFKRNGLTSTVVQLANGGAISAAVLSGAADIGYSNVISLSLAHARGLPVTIIAPANLHLHDAPTAGIMVVKKSSPIQNARDLNDKVVAVIGISNIADIAVRNWIDQNGGDQKTVKFVELPFSEMKPALEAGRIDAASLDQTGDPLLGKPGDTLRVIGNAFDSLAHRFVPSVWFTTSDWVAKHPLAARAFVTAMRETAQWANTHHRESAAILATYTHDTPEQIQSVTRVTYGDRVTPDLIQPDIDAAVRYGVLKTPFPASELIAVLD